MQSSRLDVHLSLLIPSSRPPRHLHSFPTRRSSDLTFNPFKPNREDIDVPAFSRKVGARGWIGMTWPKQYGGQVMPDRKSTRLNSSHTVISYAVFCLKKKKRR